MTPDRWESRPSPRARYTDIEAFAGQLSAAVMSGGNSAETGPRASWVSALAQDLLAHRGACAIIPGDHQSAAVHVLAHAMNAALGNAGSPVVYTDPIEEVPGGSACLVARTGGEMRQAMYRCC